jgi:hypothetical protein
VRSSLRRSKAASPAGRIRPASRSRATFSMFTFDQLLDGLRGVKRCMWRSSSILFRRPSIHPKHSAWSTACDHVSDGFPVCFFQ